MSEESTKVMRRCGLVKGLNVGDDEMALINKHTLEPLTKEQVFTFEIVACDNELDRDYERFDEKALKELAKLFDGRTVIKDHRASTDNQVGRVFSAQVVDGDGKTFDGQPLKQLVVKCYVLDNAANAQIVGDIKAGIKKEVSVGFNPGSVTCSVCGTDRRKSYCGHWWGKEYDGKTCYFTLSDIKDAYELSFVAVPAQRGAGVKKEYLLEEESPPEAVEKNHVDEAPETGAFSLPELEVQMAIEKAFLEIQSMKKEA